MGAPSSSLTPTRITSGCATSQTRRRNGRRFIISWTLRVHGSRAGVSTTTRCGSKPYTYASRHDTAEFCSWPASRRFPQHPSRLLKACEVFGERTGTMVLPFKSARGDGGSGGTASASELAAVAAVEDVEDDDDVFGHDTIMDRWTGSRAQASPVVKETSTRQRGRGRASSTLKTWPPTRFGVPDVTGRPLGDAPPRG
jgi:hypothetical protein